MKLGSIWPASVLLAILGCGGDGQGAREVPVGRNGDATSAVPDAPTKAPRAIATH